MGFLESLVRLTFLFIVMLHHKKRKKNDTSFLVSDYHNSPKRMTKGGEKDAKK